MCVGIMGVRKISIGHRPSECFMFWFYPMTHSLHSFILKKEKRLCCLGRKIKNEKNDKRKKSKKKQKTQSMKHETCHFIRSLENFNLASKLKEKRGRDYLRADFLVLCV